MHKDQNVLYFFPFFSPHYAGIGWNDLLNSIQNVSLEDDAHTLCLKSPVILLVISTYTRTKETK